MSMLHIIANVLVRKESLVFLPSTCCGLHIQYGQLALKQLFYYFVLLFVCDQQ